MTENCLRNTILPIERLQRGASLSSSRPWKYSRNPLYLGLIIMGLGFSLFFASYADALFTLVGAGFLHLEVITHEEKILSQAFGVQYLNYKRQVRRWI